jgi:predicted small lipoprotein YifL
MVDPIREPAVTAFSPLRLAVIGALALSFALSGCGRKGGLDPPPRSVAQSNGQQQPQQDPSQRAAAEPTEDEFGDPRVPAGQKRRFPLDGLLN